MSDSESNKKNIVIANSALSSTENKEGKEEGEGEGEGEQEQGMIEGGAKKTKATQVVASAAEGEEEKKEEGVRFKEVNKKEEGVRFKEVNKEEG